MSRETREGRKILNKKGTVTDRAGKIAKVRFSLITTQDFIDGIPTLRSASGTLEFESMGDAWAMTESTESKTLRGGGIQAEVILLSAEKFVTTGAIKDI